MYHPLSFSPQYDSTQGSWLTAYHCLFPQLPWYCSINARSFPYLFSPNQTPHGSSYIFKKSVLSNHHPLLQTSLTMTIASSSGLMSHVSVTIIPWLVNCSVYVSALMLIPVTQILVLQGSCPWSSLPSARSLSLQKVSIGAEEAMSEWSSVWVCGIDMSITIPSTPASWTHGIYMVQAQEK